MTEYEEHLARIGNPLVGGTGFIHAELEAAFARVRNPENWKRPINALVPLEADIEAIRAAVPFFTGSVASFLKTKKGYRVRARGYYATIGA